MAYLDIDILLEELWHCAIGEATGPVIALCLKLLCRKQPIAGSLPSDDVTLARMAGFGRDVKSWLEIKDVALNGWVLCNNFRWYHPETAIELNIALDKYEQQKLNAENARQAKAAKKALRDAQKQSKPPLESGNHHAGDDAIRLRHDELDALQRGLEVDFTH